jgi:hypothetical protein
MPSDKIIVLFDEYGTPTLRQDRESRIFIGVGACYKNSDELMIFHQIEDLIGLQNKKPVKNNRLPPERAVKIAQELKQLPIFFVVVTIDLSNIDLIETVTEYQRISNQIRKKERNIKERPIAQIIHSKILSNCLFESITLCLENSQDLKTFEIFIDAWSIPAKDIPLYLNFRTESLSRHISDLFPNVTVQHIQLLKDDTKRKRFIDSVTSVVSRKYYPTSNTKFTSTPFDILFANSSGRSICVDITEKEMAIMKNMLNEIKQNG